MVIRSPPFAGDHSNQPTIAIVDDQDQENDLNPTNSREREKESLSRTQKTQKPEYLEMYSKNKMKWRELGKLAR